jgi:hypothetical protein
LEERRFNDEQVAALNARLRPLISPRELDAFWRRYDTLLEQRIHPNLDARYNIPYGFA